MPVSGQKTPAESRASGVSGNSPEGKPAGALEFEAEPNGALPGSYALRLWKSPAEKPPQAAPLGACPEFSTTPPDPQKESLKRKVAEKLIQQNPRLQMRKLPHDRIAQFEKISLEEARRKYRHLELELPESGSGIQITLSDEEASVAVPFWHDGDKAANAIRELWSCVETICRETGYCVYDPQAGRSFEAATGPDAVLANYTGTARRLLRPFPINGEQSGVEVPRPQGSLPSKGDRERQAAEIRRLVTSEGCGVVLVAVQATGVLCGFAEVSVSHDPVAGALPGPVAWLKGWYVAPEFRGRGIGRRLLEAAEKWTASRGLKELASSLDQANEKGMQAYLAFGFKEKGRAVRLVKAMGKASGAPEGNMGSTEI